MGELVKGLLSTLLQPLSLVILASAVGLVLMGLSARLSRRFGQKLRWRRRVRRAGLVTAALGLVGLYLLAIDPVGDALENSLVRHHAVVGDPAEVAARHTAPPLRLVVVLGSYYYDEPELPPTSRLPDESLLRLLEGIRLYRALDGAKLVITGGPLEREGVSIASGMAEVARSLGVPKADLVIEPEAANTYQHVSKVAPLVGEEPFFLVTSAIHLPRAMALFGKGGLNAIPAPATRRPPGWPPGWRQRRLESFVPKARNLRRAERVFHEWQGLLWGRLRGQW